jgi:hypothetical protein
VGQELRDERCTEYRVAFGVGCSMTQQTVEGRIAKGGGYVIKYPAHIPTNHPQQWFVCDENGRIKQKGSKGLPMHECIALVVNRRLHRVNRFNGASLYQLREVTA